MRQAVPDETLKVPLVGLACGGCVSGKSPGLGEDELHFSGCGVARAAGQAISSRSKVIERDLFLVAHPVFTHDDTRQDEEGAGGEADAAARGICRRSLRR